MSKAELQVPQSPLENLGHADSVPTNFHRNLLTPSDVQVLVKRSLGRDAKVCSFSLSPYADGKLGFLGTHQRLYVEVEIGDGKRMLHFFVKSVPYDVPMQAEYVFTKGVFELEAGFYGEMVPQLLKEFNGEPWAASCYLMKSDVLVFEDLAIKGYSMKNKRFFNKDQVSSGLSAIARLHASSILAEARFGKPLVDVYPKLLKGNSLSEPEETRKWFDAGVRAAITIADHHGLDSSLLTVICEKANNAYRMSASKRNVISHGDLWGNNLLFNNDVPPKCLLVDFQLFRYCPLAHDAILFLYLCSDRDFRNLWEESMLRHYYSVLSETISSSNPSVEIPPWSEIAEGAEEHRLGALVTAVLYFPTVLMNENIAQQILNDPVSYKAYTFEDRGDIVISIMENDPIYGRRILETITELIEVGSRLVG